MREQNRRRIVGPWARRAEGAFLMRRLSSPKALASAALVLAAVQFVEAFRYLGDAGYLSVLLFAASLLGVLASVGVWRDNRFGARLTLAIIALSAVVGNTLSLIAGLPGAAADAWSRGHGAFGLISLAIAALILLMLLSPHAHERCERRNSPR